MKYPLSLYLASLGLALGSSVADATICKCERHNADARGEGYCSRTETPAFCTITFSEEDSSSSTPPSALQVLGMISHLYPGVELSPYSEAVDAADNYYQLTTPAQLTTLAAAAIPPERLSEVSAAFNELFKEGSASLDEMVRKFNTHGCVEARKDDFSVLIISRTANVTEGRCP